MSSVLGEGTKVRLIHVLRKPLSEGTVAANTLKHGTGGINIDASRISTTDNLNGGAYAANATHRAGEDMWTRDRKRHTNCFRRGKEHAGEYQQPRGRWPANVILQHLGGAGCPVARLDEQSGDRPSGGSATNKDRTDSLYEDGLSQRIITPYTDTGGASRFYKQIGKESE